MKNFILLILIMSCGSGETEKSKELAKAELYYNQGTSNLVNKKYTDALEMLLKAKAIAPGDSRIHNNLGMTYFFKEQPTLAEQHLKEAIRLDPKNTDARNNLASMHYQNGELDKAFAEYQKILEDLIYQHQYRIHYNMALIHIKNNKNYAAESELELSLKEKSDYCPAHALLGKIARSEKNYDKALRHFKEGTLGTCYNLPEMHYLKGIALIDLGKYPEARLVLKELNSKFKDDVYIKLSKQKLLEIEDKQGSTDVSLDTLPSSQKKILDEIENVEYESVKF